MTQLLTKKALQEHLGVGKQKTEELINEFLNLGIILSKTSQTLYFHLDTVNYLLESKTKYSYQNKKKPLGSHLEMTEEDINLLETRFTKNVFTKLVPHVNLMLGQKKRNTKPRSITEMFEEVYQTFEEQL